MFKVLNLVTMETGFLVKDRIWRFEEESLNPDFLLFPSFFNAHTHLADSVVEAPRLSLLELVGPGGFKFRVLGSKSEAEIVESMKKSVELVRKTSATSLEFREGGVRGYEIYLKSDPEKIIMALARPENEEEAELLSEIALGFNFSSVRDVDYKFLEYCRDIAKKKDKIFAIHAGEVDSGDVEGALSLEPDFIIHMNMADRKLLKMAMDEEIRIVSCLRSNAFFGVFNLENYRILSEYEYWHLGTDNAMIASPSMLDELKFAVNFIDADKLFSASTGNPFFESYTLASLANLPNLSNPVLSVVKRLESCDIELIIREKVKFA